MISLSLTSNIEAGAVPVEQQRIPLTRIQQASTPHARITRCSRSSTRTPSSCGRC